MFGFLLGVGVPIKEEGGMMDLFNKWKKFNLVLCLIAGVALVSMMLLTISDVILREFRRPVVGTYELVGYLAVIVLGFSIPYTTSVRSHVVVDFFTTKLPEKVQSILLLITRCMGVFLFILMGYDLLLMARDYYRSGEVSPTLQVPFYPFIFAIGVCCFLQSFTQVAHVITILSRRKV
ncbi:MAG: TRAP transporter small permease [Thermodesulfobacteriota bacterium]